MKTVTGIFDNKIAADIAVSELLEGGLDREDISLLMSEQTRHKLFSSTDDEESRTAKGAVVGATFGGVLGALLAGLTSAGAIITTGGAVLVSGPIVAVLSGVGVGTVAGGIAGALIRAGFADDEANRYAEEIKRGKAVIIVHASDEQKAAIARNAFENAGAVMPQAA